MKTGEGGGGGGGGGEWGGEGSGRSEEKEGSERRNCMASAGLDQRESTERDVGVAGQIKR